MSPFSNRSLSIKYKKNYMKIGILTQPLTTNYGGILQNYALQTILKRMGHEVWTLDYFSYNWIDWAISNSKIIVLKLLGRSVKWAITPTGKKKLESPLRQFVKENVSLTTPRTKWFERKIVQDYHLDGLVVGSDQVWRPIYNTRIVDLFLDFVKDFNIKRIAYAASFGTDSWGFTDIETNQCKILAQKFNAISVREVTGVSLCEKYLGVKAKHVLDPTLLLTADDYLGLCKNIPVKSPFVFAYVLDQNPQKISEIKRFAQEKELPCFIMSAGPNVSDDDRVEKWLSYFRDAAYVITDSFHGTVFSIILQKDFYVFGNKKRGNSRFDSLLNFLGLSNRIIEVEISELPTIDWKLVHTSLNDERINSTQWLEHSLNN